MRACSSVCQFIYSQPLACNLTSGHVSLWFPADAGDASGSSAGGAGTPLPDEPTSPSATGPVSPVRSAGSSLGLSSFFGGAQKQALASINKQGAAAAGSITAALSRQGSVPPAGLAAAAAGAAVGDSFLQALAQVNQEAHDTPPGHALGEAVAVVVDAEVTSYLMMGAVSPGLKRHSVTLFEGGRISGDELIEELIAELWVTYTMGQQLEGELAQLTTLLAGLAVVLECAKKPLTEGGEQKQLELLRKESLAGKGRGGGGYLSNGSEVVAWRWQHIYLRAITLPLVSTVDAMWCLIIFATVFSLLSSTMSVVYAHVHTPSHGMCARRLEQGTCCYCLCIAWVQAVAFKLHHATCQPWF